MNDTTTPKKVLIADDDKLLRESLARALAEHGYQVAQAADGEEALSAAQNNKPDIIITDVLMPKMDGLAMLQKVRQTDWGKNLPAIVLTIKDTDVEDVNKSMEVGTAAYLSKSDISPEQIVSLVGQQLHGQNT